MGEVGMEEQVEILPEVAAEVEVGLPDSAAPAAAAASWLLPAAPTESGPAAASAVPRSLSGNVCGDRKSVV